MKFIGSRVIILLLSFYFSGTQVYSQAPGCQVLLASIAGKYTGGCRQGKAEGNGKSVGKDQYTGAFKAGLPDGSGTYVWENGDIFKGAFVMGVREGQGTLAVKRAGKGDSIVTGVWKQGQYAGAYVKPEKPFTIYQRSNYIGRSDIRKNPNSKENSILFNVTNVSGGASTLAGMTLGPGTITDIVINRGSYAMVQDGTTTTRGSSKKLVEVNFPFRATVRIGEQEIDMEITEPGAWTVTLVMNQ